MVCLIFKSVPKTVFIMSMRHLQQKTDLRLSFSMPSPVIPVTGKPSSGQGFERPDTAPNYNLRCQTNSKFSPGLKLDVDLIVDDAIGLLDEIKPPRPIMVGLSIGGFFAAKAWLKGAEALGLLFINTLRRNGPRLKWIGDALVRAAEVGGLDLFRDLFLPLLMNEEWLATNRSSFLKPEPEYAPLSPESGHYKLLAEAGREADWDHPYERLDLPVLVITGLQDHVFLEPDVVEDRFSRFPRGQRVDIPEAGHLVPAERPEVLVDSLLSFIKEVS